MWHPLPVTPPAAHTINPLNRQTGQTEIPAPRAAYSSSSGARQTQFKPDKPAKNTAAERTHRDYVDRTARESCWARSVLVHERQNSPKHDKSSSDEPTRQSETVPSLKQQRHFLARRTGCVTTHGTRERGRSGRGRESACTTASDKLLNLHN